MKHYESLYEIYISFPFDFGVKYDSKPFTPCQMICSGYRINIPIAQISFFVQEIWLTFPVFHDFQIRIFFFLEILQWL